MSFDQNMIIDATTGSIARFVNHSCNPNCRMIKWIVSGQPRMALFAGDKPIMTGEELTYDYNFDPFSAKNVQSCLCGEPNCRGILGPKTREQKAKVNLQKAVKETISTGKRKLKEMIGDGEDKTNKPKKPRITSTREALATVGLKMAKGTATAIRKGMASTVGNTKKALSSQASAKKTTGSMMNKATANRVSKAYGKGGVGKKQAALPAPAKSPKGAKGAAAKTAASPKKPGPKPGAKAAAKSPTKTAAKAAPKTAKATTAKTTVKATAKVTAKAAPKTQKPEVTKTSVKATAKKVVKTVKAKTASSKTAVTKARAPKKNAGPRMTAAERKRKEELDRQYEIPVGA